MDFAVTSLVQQRVVVEASQYQLSAEAAYEDYKMIDCNTRDRRRRFGVQLVHMIVESHGGWGKTAQKVFNLLVRAAAARIGKSVSETPVQLYSGHRIKSMRANARSGHHAAQLDRARPILAATA